MLTLFNNIVLKYKYNNKINVNNEENILIINNVSYDDDELTEIKTIFKNYKEDRNFGGNKELIKICIFENYNSSKCDYIYQEFITKSQKVS